jgi:hypothetical protein
MPLLLEAMTIEEIIIKIENEKREKKIKPVHASFLEIQREVKAELNRLVSEKKITFGELLNDIYFKHEINQVKED